MNAPTGRAGFSVKARAATARLAPAAGRVAAAAAQRAAGVVRGVRLGERRAIVVAAALVLGFVLAVTGIVALVVTSVGAPATAARWQDPVDGPFKRGTPFWKAGKAWKWKGHHTGVDYEAAAGTPVVAAGAGTIMVKGPGGAYGNHIEINHGTVDGQQIITLYAHLSRYAGVRVGDKVQAGDRIGYVGETGNAFGPHLHFEVRVNWRGGVKDSEFADGWKWIDSHRGSAPAPRIIGDPAGDPNAPALDSDDGQPR